MREITVAIVQMQPKLGEAEVMGAAGIRDVLIRL